MPVAKTLPKNRVFRSVMVTTLTVSMLAVVAGCGTTKSGSTGGGKGNSSNKSATSNTSSQESSKGKVTIDIFEPFSGHDAALGATFCLPGALAAAAEINASGGIMGKRLVITHTDSRGDPADAVPGANQLIATHPPSAILGPTSDTALAVIPIFNQAKIVMMSPAGNPQLNKKNYPYLYRPVAPDNMQGVAMAVAALKSGYKRAALLFGADPGSQNIAPSLIKTFTSHGGKIVYNGQLTLGQPSYRSDITKMLAAKPQVIFTASPPQTAATAFSELKQINGLKIPVIGPLDASGQAYLSAVGKAVGGRKVLGSFLESVIISSSKTYGVSTYKKYFKAANSNSLKNLNAGLNPNYYDSVNVLALAMTMAKSTKSQNYVKYIKEITNNPSNVHVSTYAAALADLKNGKHIYWDGAGGNYPFTKNNYVPGQFAITKMNSQGNMKPTTYITSKELKKYLK